jgi:hypothetical protein
MARSAEMVAHPTWLRIQPPLPVSVLHTIDANPSNTRAPVMMTMATVLHAIVASALGEVRVLLVSLSDSWSSAASNNARSAGLAAVIASRRMRTAWVRDWVEKGGGGDGVRDLERERRVDGEVRPAAGPPLPSPWRRAEGGAVGGGDDGQCARDWRGNTCEVWLEVADVSMGGADPGAKPTRFGWRWWRQGFCWSWGRHPQQWRRNPCMPSRAAELGFG